MNICCISGILWTEQLFRSAMPIQLQGAFERPTTVESRLDLMFPGYSKILPSEVEIARELKFYENSTI